MHLIKKYANRKLYDTTDKRYLTMDRLAELIKAGEEVSIVDNETGDDLTASIVSQLLARESAGGDKAVPSQVLMQMLRKGRGTLFGYGKKYVGLWQSALTLSKDEIEKRINSLINDKEISESDGRNLKNEVLGFANNLKTWIMDHIDERVTEAFKALNLASRDRQLKDQIKELRRRVDELERALKQMGEK